ncbi:MAG: Ig-like domain-containing protein [Paludibacteraceae bacterium]
MKYKLKKYYLLLILTVLIVACANRGQGPQGGPKDEVPPKLLQSSPADKAVNITNSKIEFEFDENIVLKDISKNVIISPPQRTTPEITSYGKRLTVNFKDSLQSNTTYSINFGDAVVDNNEGNILKDFVFSFATGNEIDTLRMSGVLINAEDLNPMKGVIVGIHSDLNDSAFVSNPFSRITKSGDEGKFTVYNTKQARYRVYALNDLNRDNFYQKGEGAAFIDSIYETSMEDYMRQDTLWKDSITVDTIRTVKAIRYLPNTILLKYFKDDTKRQYIAKSERAEPHKINIYFNTKNEIPPDIRPVNADWNDRMLLQRSVGLDTLTYWLTDSVLIKQDTIRLEINYLKTDSVFKLQLATDTVSLFMRRAAKPTSRQSASTSSKKEFLGINTNVSSKFDVYKSVTLNFNTPIKNYDLQKIHLSQLKDTLLVPIEYTIQKKDSVGMNFVIDHKWIPETTYQLDIDSAAFVSIYDLHNDKLKNELKIRSLEEYSGLKLVLSDFDSTAVYQVVDKTDKVVRTAPIQPNATLIQYLEPGDYYVRMFLDKNGNGKWDTGSVLEKRQPEEVFYYSKKLTLIKNWEFEETWDHTSVPIQLQKPDEIKKTVEPGAGDSNKP